MSTKPELLKFKVRFQKSEEASDCEMLGYYFAKTAEEAIEKCLKEKKNPDYFMYKSKVIATVEMQPFRGDIWLADFSGLDGERKAERPVVVISNNIGNKHGSTVTVACITSQEAKDLPTHMDIKLAKDSVVLAERIKTIPKYRLSRFIRRMTEDEVEQLEEKLLISLGFITNWEQRAEIDTKILDVKCTMDRLNALSEDKEYAILSTKDGATYFLRENNFVLAHGSSDDVLLALSNLLIEMIIELKEAK